MDGALSLRAHAGAWKGELDCIRIKSTLCGKAVWEDESERKRVSPPVLYGAGGFFTQAEGTVLAGSAHPVRTNYPRFMCCLNGGLRTEGVKAR